MDDSDSLELELIDVFRGEFRIKYEYETRDLTVESRAGRDCIPMFFDNPADVRKMIAILEQVATHMESEGAE